MAIVYRAVLTMRNSLRVIWVRSLVVLHFGFFDEQAHTLKQGCHVKVASETCRLLGLHGLRRAGCG